MEPEIVEAASRWCLFALTLLPILRSFSRNEKFVYERLVIKKFVNIMCSSKSFIQMFNELTLMHAFRFTFFWLFVLKRDQMRL